MKPPESPLFNESDSSVSEMDTQVLRYLSLPVVYSPKPSEAPVQFLRQHLPNLPPSLLQHRFAPLLSPLARTVLPAIRNRRLAYHSSAPPIFKFSVSRNKWVDIWDEIAPSSVLQENWREETANTGREEEQWAERSFLGDREVVGDRKRLGKLLGGYEEERVGDENRQLRSHRMRERRAREERELEALQNEPDLEEEESGDDDDDDERMSSVDNVQLQRIFERLIKERFIDGRLKVSP